MAKSNLYQNFLQMFSTMLIVLFVAVAPINAQEKTKQSPIIKNTIEIVSETNTKTESSEPEETPAQSLNRETTAINNESIPSTGPAETMAAIAGIVALGITVRYLLRSKSELKTSLLNAK